MLPSALRLFHPEPHNAALDPAERDRMLDRTARELVRRGLVTPAVFFLELNRPLSFLAGQTAHVLLPFLAPLCGVRLARQLAELLEDPANVDRLLERIEQKASAP